MVNDVDGKKTEKQKEATLTVVGSISAPAKDGRFLNSQQYMSTNTRASNLRPLQPPLTAPR